MNCDVHGGQARCGAGAGASRFLIGLVTCYATQDGIPAVARAALSAAAEDPSRSPGLRQVVLRLPDGRDLEVTVQVTDAGDVRDEDGRVIDYDGCAHADVSGDFTLHVAARRVIDSATAPYCEPVTAERAAEIDERRIRWKLDRHLPAMAGDDRLQAMRDDVCRRATARADATVTRAARRPNALPVGGGGGGARGALVADAGPAGPAGDRRRDVHHVVRRRLGGWR